MSNYGFDKFIVQETNISVAVNNYLSIAWQGMLENHGSHRNISTLSINIPEGYGSYRASKEKTIVRGDLPRDMRLTVTLMEELSISIR